MAAFNYDTRWSPSDTQAAFNNAYGAQQAQSAVQKQQLIDSLSQGAVAGDMNAFNQLMAIDPQRAAQLKQLTQGQQVKIPDMEAVGADLAVIQRLAKSGSSSLPQVLNSLATKYQGTGFDAEIGRWAQAFMQNPEQAIAELDSTVSAFTQPSKESDFAPEVSPLQTDPETGQQYVVMTDRNTGQANRVDVVGGKADTGDQKMNRDIRKELLKQAADVSRESFDQLKTVRSQIGNFDEAIRALESGAQSGPFQQMLPSIRQSTIELENAAQRLGLDVISATTFGALSEGELRLAMSTAVPLSLEPAALKDWLIKKKKAQQKLGSELYKMATTLGKGKTTVAEYLEQNNYSAAPAQQSATPRQPVTQPTTQDPNVINWADL